MSSRLHLSFPLILLILLASLTFWLDQAVQPLATAQDDVYRNPDYIVEDISGIRMNHELAIQQTFFAKKMFHYRHEESTQLEQTHFVSTAPDKPVMSVDADQAELSGNGADVYLTGNVVVLRGAEENEDKVTMKTSSLHLIPGEDIAKTDQAVVISRLNTTITGVGLDLNNRTGVIKLLSQIRAVDLNDSK